MTNNFVVAWDQHGLETVISENEFQEENTLAVLSDLPKHSLGRVVDAIQIRSRINSHREYEVYAIAADNGITSESIKTLFDWDLKIASDLIRSKGKRL